VGVSRKSIKLADRGRPQRRPATLLKVRDARAS
jgi:hypothetical protein